MVHMFPSRGDAKTQRSSHSWAVIGIFIILFGAVIAQARNFLMPVTLAILLFLVFVPVRRWLWRKGIPPVVTASGVTLLLVVFVAVMGTLLVQPARDLITDMPRISAELEDKLRDLRDSLTALKHAADKIDEISESASSSGPSIVTKEDSGGMIGTLTTYVPGFFSQLLFTLLLLFFLLASGDLLYLKIVQSFDSMRDKRRAYLALREIEDRIGNYLGAITLINICLGLAIGTAMYLIGMPSPAMFGALAFLLNFIPYIGMMIGVTIITAVALVSFDGYYPALIAAGSYVFMNSVEGQIITPYFVSRRLRMNTVVVFLSVALWAWLWSIIGMIVAVPLLVVIRVLSEHIPALEKFGNFLGDTRPAEPEEVDEADPEETVAPQGVPTT